MKGLRALVTGADGSLGAEIVREMESRGVRVWGLPRGLCAKSAIDAAVDAACAEAGAFDWLILNDGTNHLSWIGATEGEDARVVELNLLAPYWVLNRFVHNHPAALDVRVLFIASQTYRVAQRTTALYCASKAGMVQMMRVAARELGPRGWAVNALAPGKIADTRMSQLTDAQVTALRGWDPEEADEYARSLIPAQRYTCTAEVADAVLWALQAPRYVSGAVLEVMGGV